ncbi:MAG: SusF/SusE family outer membrane protein [Bacteroidales bacterium]|nr:SusF/SusE family outer membrane protein [Bacteroidales bacterium]
MKNQNKINSPSGHGNYYGVGLSLVLSVLVVFSMSFLTSCVNEEETDIALAGELALSASSADLVLEQINDANTALTLSWTTGTNNGSGASISYKLEIDRQGNNFADPLTFEMGKAVYEKAFTVSGLNATLLGTFNVAAGTEAVLESRVISTIYDTPAKNDVSDVITFKVTPYEPVTTTLYLLGTVLPTGWEADNALVMTPDAENPTIFSFRGAFGVGEFKFITTLGSLLPAYQRGADENHLVYRTAESQPDNKFSVTEAGVYNIVVSLLDLTIEVVKLDLPAYEHIYMVGGAAPNGWDITNATELVQDPDNPSIFTYSGVMNAGEFKFPVNRNSDWSQDMFMRLTDSTMYLHHGGDPDDNKWTIEKKGYYIITLNLSDNTISMKRTKLYMVGSATPIGWTITDAIELVEDATDGCIFTYSGPMVAGEFKFPVNRNSDWGQDMYMRVSDTEMYRHVGGAPDDNKWNITVDGDYVIIANIETLGISIQKQ